MNRTQTGHLWLAAIVLAAAAGGCALLSKSAPLQPRFFSPERPGEPPAPALSDGPAAELRLGRIVGAPHLEERLVFRSSRSELGYYQLRRWTEAPQHYLERLLARVLFEERRLRQVVGGGGPTLDVQLTAFEELLGPRHLARVQVVARLHDERIVSWEETLTVDLPVSSARSGDSADPVVEALGLALRETVERIARRVVRELTTAAAVTPASASVLGP